MANRAVFIDRDGTLIEHVPYITKPSEVKLKPNIGRALRLLRDRGYLLVLVTNQSGVGRGYLTEDTLSEIHDELKSQLYEQGVWLDQIYYCPFHPQATLAEYRENSPMRKPAPGMLELASSEMEIDLHDSWMIGDDDRDVEAGQGAGCKTIFIESYNADGVKRGNSNPDFKVVNFQEAANVVIRQDGINGTADTQSETEISSEAEKEISNDDVNKKEASQNLKLPKENENNFNNIAVEQTEPQMAPALTAVNIVPKDKKKKKVKKVKLDKNSASDNISSKAPDDIQVQILRELKAINRHNEFNEFSVVKMIGAIMQMAVVLFLVLTVMAAKEIHPDYGRVQSWLLAGGVFQLITLSCWVAHKSK
jgi:D-glycero-D-manno-heptose 1,7-bisphosphate phosphatase